MGMFSFLDKPFRTGATQAARDAKAAGNVQLERENAFMGELGGLYNPAMQAGNLAAAGIADYYSGNQQPIINQAMQSPMYSSLLSQGENAIARNAQATGGFRTGSTQQNLAQNSQSVLMNQINQILQGQQYVANTGTDATNAYAQNAGNILGQIGGTSGQIANVDIAKAANRGQLLLGAGQAAAEAYAASDIALKSDIKQIGTRNNLNWYTWEWNDKANDIGLYGSSEGYIAQEVEKVRPDLVTTKNGYKAVNYEGF